MKSVLKKNIASKFIFILLIILLIPSFWRMLKPGIYSMHDFHIFRQYEYDKCIGDLQIPCRWAPDSGYDYGEPLFNYYTQVPYALGEVFRAVDFSVIDTVKILFILSLVLSSFSMYLLSYQIWGNKWSAMLSGVIYIYAPYRAVDVFVRGALPEAFSFTLYPLILYFFNDYIRSKKMASLLLFALTLSLLILTHNLSAFMFLFFLSIWGLYRLFINKSWNLLPKFLIAGVFIFGITAFYILPILSESKYITLNSTTNGYYDFRNHFVTLKQLLISRFWGYGASVWGDGDGLSLSVGHIQWILPLILALILIVRRQFKKYLDFFILFGLGWFMLFLTHNKSEIIWLHIQPMSYIQFPWRFLGLAIFSFSICSGVLMVLISQIKLKISSLNFMIFVLIFWGLVILNISFFFEDFWYNFTDKEYFSGFFYEWQTSSALGDFWPNYGNKLPNHLSDHQPQIIQGTGMGRLVIRQSNLDQYQLQIKSPSAQVRVPIDFFPGWTGYLDNKNLDIYPSSDLGLITANVTEGEHTLLLKFENTLVRTIGNMISLISISILGILFFKLKKKKV